MREEDAEMVREAEQMMSRVWPLVWVGKSMC